MNRIVYMLWAMLTLAMAACSDSEPVYNDLPAKVSSFISEYYPNQKVDSYQANASGCVAVINDGPTISFDKQYAWTSVNGNGSPLPQQMLYDQLPSKLYSYLEQIDCLNAVFSMSRNATSYKLTLLNSAVDYTISTETITQSAVTAR